MAVDVRRGRPPAAEVARVEMTARRQEASLYTRAQRVLLRDLEAVLLRHSAEIPVEAIALVARLRGMTDRYDGLWSEAAA